MSRRTSVPLQGHAVRCIHDQNGNHVIQKAIECVPTDKLPEILEACMVDITALSAHSFGCRIVQRILEHCTLPHVVNSVMNTVLAATGVLTRDQFGNYVIQHVVQHGTRQQRSHIISKLAPNVVQLAQHKFASNVIEKCLMFGSAADRELLVSYVLARPSSAGGERRTHQPGEASDGAAAGDAPPAGEDNLVAMMKHQFGNYVVQKLLEMCSPQQQEMLLARIRSQAPALRKYPYCKHILARVDKMIAALAAAPGHVKEPAGDKMSESTSVPT